MDSVLKIFVSGAEQDKLAEQIQVIEQYDGFLLVKLSPAEKSEISSRYPTEDITSQYFIPAGQRKLDTDIPRVDDRGKTLGHPDYKGVRKLATGAHHYLVQFIGPIKKTWLEQVVATGGKLQSPYAGFSYVVRADESTLAEITALPFIRWTGHLSHSDRVAPSVLKYARRKRNQTESELPRSQVLPGLLEVEFFDGDTMKPAAKAIKALGFDVLEQDQAALLMILQLSPGSGSAKRIKELSAVHGVRFIREHSLKRPSNDLSPRLMGAEQLVDDAGLGLDGSGEIVAVCDTGLDTGEASTLHADFKGRVSSIMSYPIKSYFSPYINNPGGDDGAADYDSGHGTHVAGSVLGNGKESEGLSGLEGPIRGLAYKSKLVFQAVEQEMEWKNTDYYQSIGRYLLAGIPNDLKTLFADAYDKKARIHSNSWGGGDPGVYDSQCEQLDRFVWEHKDFCVLVAAGNDGTDKDGDGKINSMSVTSPATAKNCICVGASENDRPHFNEGKHYGDWWPNDYPVAPYNSDAMADNPDEIVPFSSRGPTEDGRIRPDVVAPGTFVLSTRSSMIARNNTAWAAFPASRKYFHMGGTSMATPLVAGAATLVRQYLRTQAKISKPSAALIKATLIAGARRLPNPGSDGLLADNDQGFGRVNLQAILKLEQPAQAEFIDVIEALETGEVWSRDIQISSSEIPFKVVLCYSDYPGTNLVNNLNLILRSPDGSRTVGNASTDESMSMDSTNNVEVIQIDTPMPGTWKLDVVASNVAEAAQDFALVIMAATGEASDNNLVSVSSSPGVKIPDFNTAGISDSLNIPQDGTVVSVAVDIDISHTYIGDLLIQLISPDDIIVTLHDRQGASTNNIRKQFDVNNTADLQLLAGSEISGEWTLHISDHARIDTGTLNSWTLNIVSQQSSWEMVESDNTLPIPDNDPDGISDSLDISGSGNISDLEVWVDITHTWIGDLKVKLTSPSGTNVMLHERSGGRQDNLIKVFDAEMIPAMNEFINHPGSGSWTLNVSDNEGRDTGKLNGWGLRVKF